MTDESDDPAELDDPADSEPESSVREPKSTWEQRRWPRVLAFVVLPIVVVALTMVAGALKWYVDSTEATEQARVESVLAARETTARILTYDALTVEQQLLGARDLLTGEFRDSYTESATTTVIPDSRRDDISTVANVIAAASVSASKYHAVVLIFVNQTKLVGDDSPTEAKSRVRVTLDKVDGRWLVSQFEPV